MKMKELLNILEERNVIVTERMVRHYLELGLLPEPERPSKNQAIYNEDHYKRLLAINMFKNNGLSLDEIKAKMDELSYYYHNMREELSQSYDKEILSEPNMLAHEKLNEIALDKSLIEAEYPQLAQLKQLFSKKQVLKELACSEKDLNAVIRFLGMENGEYFDSIDLFAVKTHIFYQKARELSYHLDDTIPEVFDQDVPYDLNIEKELHDTLEIAKMIVKNANMNPFLNILLKAMIAYIAKESLLSREISDITWEGLNLGWVYKTRYED
ncbi:MAG: MerR family transcriptional regulator [Desulfotomaculaceae bacterium]|nr:MerR family transcriptional regulator [Desulfotomaculaceae bacterium]